MSECRICGKKINKEKDDWIMPSNNYYFHRSCYEKWKNTEPTKDEDYIPFIYDFIARDLKVKYDWHMCEAQRKKFIKEYNLTNKGIFYALKYFYELRHGNWEKGHGGIGIVPFIYNDSHAYWAARERIAKGTLAEIERQMREASIRGKIVVKKEHKKKFETNFSVLDELEDEE